MVRIVVVIVGLAVGALILVFALGGSDTVDDQANGSPAVTNEGSQVSSGKARTKSKNSRMRGKIPAGTLPFGRNSKFRQKMGGKDAKLQGALKRMRRIQRRNKAKAGKAKAVEPGGQDR